MLDFMIATPKGTSLRGTVLWHILRQNRSRGLIGCSELQEPPPQNGKKTNTFWRAKSRMRGNETPAGRIVTNFCTGVGVYDVITSANFYDCRLWGLSVVGGSNLGFLHWLASSPLQHSRTTVRVCDLQSVLNAAARLVYNGRKYHHFCATCGTVRNGVPPARWILG